MTALPFLCGVRLLPHWGPVLRLVYPNGPAIEIGFELPDAWGRRPAFVFDLPEADAPPRSPNGELEFLACEVAGAEYYAAVYGQDWSSTAPNSEIAASEGDARESLRRQLARGTAAGS